MTRSLFCRSLALALAVLMAAAAMAAAAAHSGEDDTVHAAGDVTVLVNGVPLTFDVTPRIVRDRLLVPLRAIFEALGATVEWQADTQTVVSRRGDITVRLGIGEPTITTNGRALALDVAARLFEGRTLVPLRAVSEGLGATVAWDGNTRTVTITLPGAGEPAGAAQAHIDHLLSRNPEGGKGYAVLLQEQARGAVTHAGLAARSETVAAVKAHADHVHAYLTGSLTGLLPQNANPADNGDPRGYALTRYAAATRTHAQLAAGAADATANVKLHAGHVGNAVQNLIGDGNGGWAAAAAAQARAIVATGYDGMGGGGIAAARADAQSLLRWAEQILHGSDANGNGSVDPTAGEAGAETAYTHAQYMAQANLEPATAPTADTGAASHGDAGDGGAGDPHSGAGAAADTPAVVNLDVALADFAFVPDTLTATAGQTVVLRMRNTGAAPHTFTIAALDIDTVLPAGSTTEITLPALAAGEYRLVCRFHTGLNMVGTLTVQPAP